MYPSTEWKFATINGGGRFSPTCCQLQYQNAWLLYRLQIAAQMASTGDDARNTPDQHESPKLDLLGFTRSNASTLLLLSNTDRSQPGRPPTSVKKVLVRKIPDAVRKNYTTLIFCSLFSKYVGHHPVNMKQWRCRACKKNTTLGCSVCRLNMHAVECLNTFHEIEHSNQDDA